MTNVTIGNSVTSVGNYSFYYCTSLGSITVPNSVRDIEVEALAYCTSLTNVTIGSGATNIGYGPFMECTSLTTILVDPLNPAYSSVDGVLFDRKPDDDHRMPGRQSWNLHAPQ